jgi:serine/threonine protein kinase
MILRRVSCAMDTIAKAMHVFVGESVAAKLADALPNTRVTLAELGRKIARRRSSTSRSTETAPVPHLLGLYQAAETATAKKPSQKSDVYSFGVVLLEVLTGRSSFAQLAAGELDLVSWIRQALHERRPSTDIFDPYLVKGSIDESALIETLQVRIVNLENTPSIPNYLSVLIGTQILRNM